MTSLRFELEALLEQYDIPSISDTPDSVLAAYLLACLNAFHDATRQRSEWLKSTEKP